MTADRRTLVALDLLSHRVQDHIDTIKARGRTRALTYDDIRDLCAGFAEETDKVAAIVIERERVEEDCET